MAARAVAGAQILTGEMRERIGLFDRLRAFQEQHPPPGVTVLRPKLVTERWQAIIGRGVVPGDGREMIVTEPEPDLGVFMAKLEGLFDPD